MNASPMNRHAPSPAAVPPVKVMSPEGTELMQVISLTCAEGRLMFKGKAFGAMPMSGVLRPRELRAAVRLLGFGGVLKVLLLLLCRR